MRILVLLLVCVLELMGCRSVRKSAEQKEEKQSESIVIQKDSVLVVEGASKGYALFIEQLEMAQLELHSDRDSLGNAKELYLVRFKDDKYEGLIIRGAVVHYKAASNKNQSTAEQEAIAQGSVVERVATEGHFTQEKKTAQSDKQVNVKGFTLGVWLWLIVILLLLFLAWRLKFFGLVGMVIAKFKRFLKMI